ncbi:MAG: hypothetical protein DRQ39_07350 [Gammaproteobacteria bacterium]|nr:MAG: hypothetical protein DRQ39_07350 [Gammaproteobacteria bacterium]RKZ94903.1 MAG: hypothetical protein DRQ40_04860 [Gammaproteobacteria bacterium]RKZ95616.1 MAG: hypothetical protein DRQ46_08195 [Gammaproteobacteria bacterium]
MKFSLEPLADVNHIHAYDNNSIVIKAKDNFDSLTFDTSLIITPQKIITEWPINHIVELSISDVDYFKSLGTEVLILAQQSSTQLPPEILVKFAEQAIGVESMLLGPACRTYNLLVAEGRQVVLAVNF